MRALSRVLKNESGMSLVGVMIGGSILGIMAMMMAEMFKSHGQAIQSLRTLSNRDQLVARVARLSGNGIALTGSANADTGMFAKCATGAVTNGCVEGADQPFILLDVDGTPVSGPYDSTFATPRLYDINGAACTGTTPSERCPIGVFTAFTPKCPSSSPCTVAKSISIRYIVRQVYNGAGAAGTPLRAVDMSISNLVPFDTTASGSPNKIAKWVTGSQLGDSGIYEDGSGKVGIGTVSPSQALDVNGGIKLGNATNCVAGTLRYQSSGSGSMEFCDNTGAWKSMSGGGGAKVVTGILSDGQTIPIPAGYTSVECQWLAAPKYYAYGPAAGDYNMLRFDVYADASRTIHAHWWGWSTDGYANGAMQANYMIVCSH